MLTSIGLAGEIRCATSVVARIERLNRLRVGASEPAARFKKGTPPPHQPVSRCPCAAAITTIRAWSPRGLLKCFVHEGHQLVRRGGAYLLADHVAVAQHHQHRDRPGLESLR